MCGDCNYPFSWRPGCFNVPAPAGRPQPHAYNDFFAPIPWAMTVPPTFHGHAFPAAHPFGTTFPPGPPLYCAPPPTYTESMATETSDGSSDEEESEAESEDSEATAVEPPKQKKKTKSSSPPGTKLPGGLRKGTGLLITGRPCNLNIIRGSRIRKSKLLDGTVGRFGFKSFTVQDNSTVTELLEGLGGDKTSSVTQMWEGGEGKWREGTKFSYGEEKSKKRLSELGWSGAGRSGNEPVWLYFKEQK